MTLPRPSLALATINAVCAVVLGVMGLVERHSARRHAAEFAYRPR